MITVFVYYERISLFHTMEPFFRKNKALPVGKKLFHLTSSPDWCLKHDKNPLLFMERQFQHRQPRDLSVEDLELMKRLRDKYKTIIFLCGQPEAGPNRLDLLPYVDRLFYKSVFKDRADYQKSLYGKNLFADHYHREYGICDTTEYINTAGITPEDAQRPELSWNIGVGTYPRFHWPQRAGTVLARSGLPRLGRKIARLGIAGKGSPPDFFKPRPIPVHARISPVTSPSIAYQRVLFINKIDALQSPHRELFLSGRVEQKQYYRELEESKIVLSPFGWGEVCFRDFETITAGALLFKPNMSHLETFPNVYIPYETYIPLDWDGKDLLEKAKHYLEDEKERIRIAKNAYEQYRSELSKLMDRFQSLFGEYF
jgi:hypothetical protein